MGKFIQENEPVKELVNNYFDGYLDSTNRYAKYQPGTPTFVDYYPIKLESSTQDQGLNNVTEVVGAESPVKYNKIIDFPIYLDNEVNFMQQLEDDAGFDAESEGTATVLPGTIVPQNDDLVVFKFLEKKFIYRVSNVETSNTSMRTFYRISFFISPFDIDALEKRQVEEEYKGIYENIGTELDPVIPSKMFSLIKDIDERINYLSERYIRLYYDKKMNSFIYNKDRMNLAIHEFYKDNGIYDPKLALFIKRNDLFTNQKTFLTNIFIECLLKNRDLDYEKCIYSFLETGDIEEYEYPYFFFNGINESTFMLFQDRFHELVHNPVCIYKHKYIPPHLVKDGKFTTIDLKEYVKDESLLIDEIPIKEKILVIYLRLLNYKQDNISDHFEDIVELSKEVKVDKDFDSYLLIPCVLFVLKKVREQILHKTNYIQ